MVDMAILANLLHKLPGELIVFNIVNPQPTLDCTGNVSFLCHLPQTLRNKLRFLHQTRPKAPTLDPRAGTPTVQVDFIIAELLGNYTRFREIFGVAASQLQHQGVFDWAKTEDVEHFVVVGLQDGVVVDHLGVQGGLGCEQPQEVPAEDIGDVLR